MMEGWRSLSLVGICCTLLAGAFGDEVVVETLSNSSLQCSDDLRSRENDTISYDYCGRLRNGFEFDCSFNYGRPYVFTIGKGQVIAGMDTGLTGVCVGDALKITIPSELAYGSRQTGTIPAHSDLIFYVKVLQLDRDGKDLGQTASMYKLFYRGVTAYSEDRWADVIDPLERAADLYMKEETTRKQCTVECVPKSGLLTVNWKADLVTIGLCFDRCKSTKLGRVYDETGHAFRKMQLKARQAFSFLQMAYYKTGQLEKAAASALTFYYHTPDGVNAKQNYDYYMSEEELKGKEINLTDPPARYLTLFHSALKLYNAKKYTAAANAFEDVAAAYIDFIHGCWRYCYTTDLEELPGTASDITYDLLIAYKRVLKCQLSCRNHSENVGIYTYANIQQEIYNHLHHTYIISGKAEKAAAAAGALATSVYLNPDYENASQELYKSMEGVDVNNIHPRQEVVDMTMTQKKMSDLLQELEDGLPDNPLDDDGEIQEVYAVRSIRKDGRVDPDRNLFSKHLSTSAIGPAPESIVP